MAATATVYSVEEFAQLIGSKIDAKGYVRFRCPDCGANAGRAKMLHGELTGACDNCFKGTPTDLGKVIAMNPGSVGRAHGRASARGISDDSEDDEPAQARPHLRAVPKRDPSKLSYALAYAGHRMRITPVHGIDPDRECSCGKRDCPDAGKHPRLTKWTDSATIDNTQLREWWHKWPDSNLGVVCGEESDLTVLDVDGDEGRATLREMELENGELPDTPIAITGSGGAHYYFRHTPGLINKVRFAPGLDIRNDGGQAVGVGSRSKKGPYLWQAGFVLGEQGLERARMPEWLVAKVKAAGAGTNGASGKSFEFPEEPIVEGAGRNDSLYRLGRSLKAKRLPESAIRAALAATNQERCKPPVDADELAAILKSVLKQPDRPEFAEEAKAHEEEAAPARSVLVWEDRDAAVVANEEYLARPAIVEQLNYAQAISLDVGGKHNGKSTGTRTAALAIDRGVPLWGRKTTQGHVIYAVSDDELATTRMELLRMGWNAKSDSLTLVHMDAEKIAKPEQMLDEIAEGALKHGTIFIVLDMLFDFAGIKDEMGYAHTREACGKIQQLADRTKAHVKATHHSPKWMPDAATAATAALGSQGLAARFSPIVLTRKWTDTLFSIESTMTRDPRGHAISPTVVTLDENGWSQAVGPFKDFMKWELYASRVMGLFEGGEPDKEMTVAAIARDAEIDRARAQNTLYQLWKRGDLEREKRGKAGRLYYRLPRAEQEPLLKS